MLVNLELVIKNQSSEKIINKLNYQETLATVSHFTQMSKSLFTVIEYISDETRFNDDNFYTELTHLAELGLLVIKATERELVKLEDSNFESELEASYANSEDAEFSH